MRGLVCVASRYKIDVDAFHEGIQYALEKLGKSKFRFERTAVSNFKSKRHEGSGNECSELRVLVRTKRHVGSENEMERSRFLVLTKRSAATGNENGMEPKILPSKTKGWVAGGIHSSSYRRTTFPPLKPLNQERGCRQVFALRSRQNL